MFGKKKDELSSDLKSDVPVQAVVSMRERGLNNEQVIEQLKSQGYSLQSIRDALTQAEVKRNAVSPMPSGMPVSPEMPELPPLPGEPEISEPQGMPSMPSFNEELVSSPVRAGPGLNVMPSFSTPEPLKGGNKVEEMERILEEIVDERWKDVSGKFIELETAKVKMETRLDELSKRVTELTGRLDEVSNVVMSRVDEYKKTMEDVDVEIKALEKVMQKLVPSMAEQVKELKDVVGNIKGVRQLE